MVKYIIICNDYNCLYNHSSKLYVLNEFMYKYVELISAKFKDKLFSAKKMYIIKHM